MESLRVTVTLSLYGYALYSAVLDTYRESPEDSVLFFNFTNVGAYWPLDEVMFSVRF